MKVNGQLELAQLEQIAAATATPAARGRIYMDISSPAAAVPRVYNGTTWKQLAYTSDIPTETIVSQNTVNKAATVDWSTGLVQQVVLTDNAVISFTNPQAGKTHRLIVKQTPYTAGPGPAYHYRLNMPDQVFDENNDGFLTGYNKVGVLAYGDSTTYTWIYSPGIGSAYATVPASLSNPATIAATAVTGLSINPLGTTIVYGQTASPFQMNHRMTVYGQRLFMSAANLATPATAAARVVGSCYSPGGGQFAVASGTSPFIQMWNLDAIDNPVTPVFANPATLPTGAGQCIDFHPHGTYVAIGHTTNPFMSVYPVSPSGFGLKLANPATLPPAQVNSLAFSPHGDFLAVACQTTPFIRVYAFDPVTGTIGSAAANPGVLPAGGPAGSLGKAICWSPRGDYLAMAMTTSPFLYVIPFDRNTGSFGVSIAVTATFASATSVQWSPDGNFIVVGQTAAPFLSFVDVSAAVAVAPGNILTYDGSAPTVQVNDLVFHPNNKTLIAGLNASPWLAIYPMPTKTRNYTRLI